ncbi:putative glycine-rich cell wall structural protein 1 [Helianthus annuus]|uniref:putative glycine-rich cell wall structural protein 1 n=1 Tax=Helianthus annuus TaxID=4232 RepID=UPI000B8F045B|nr:putative glycine-rich cell wall structural protein 1 [Helianthus annuus]
MSAAAVDTDSSSTAHGGGGHVSNFGSVSSLVQFWFEFRFVSTHAGCPIQAVSECGYGSGDDGSGGGCGSGGYGEVGWIDGGNGEGGDDSGGGGCGGGGDGDDRTK